MAPSYGSGPRLLLVDGHAYAYRSFHAIRGLSAPDGFPTNAIYGFVKSARKLRELLRPTHIATVWDGGLAAERISLLPEYKANRPPMPDALERQLDQMMAWLEAEGIPSVCRDGVEADDAIATLARAAEKAGMNVVIASSDKDFGQLVSDRIGLINPNDKTGAVLTPADIAERTGVRPEQIVDWLSLVGDSVDNIPGVPGVGEKTAAVLLQKFGDCDRLFARIDEVEPGRLRDLLRGAAETVRRNRQMIRLNDSVSLDIGVEGLRPREPRSDELRRLYSRWGFKSLLAELDEALAKKAQGTLFN